MEFSKISTINPVQCHPGHILDYWLDYSQGKDKDIPLIGCFFISIKKVLSTPSTPFTNMEIKALSLLNVLEDRGEVGTEGSAFHES